MKLRHPLAWVADQERPLRFEQAKELLIAIDAQRIARIRGEHLVAHRIRDTQREKSKQLWQDIYPMADHPRGIQDCLWLLHSIS
jgi:hypothetical protein